MSKGWPGNSIIYCFFSKYYWHPWCWPRVDEFPSSPQGTWGLVRLNRLHASRKWRKNLSTKDSCHAWCFCTSEHTGPTADGQFLCFFSDFGPLALHLCLASVSGWQDILHQDNTLLVKIPQCQQQQSDNQRGRREKTDLYWALEKTLTVPTGKWPWLLMYAKHRAGGDDLFYLWLIVSEVIWESDTLLGIRNNKQLKIVPLFPRGPRSHETREQTLCHHISRRGFQRTFQSALRYLLRFKYLEICVLISTSLWLSRQSMEW